MLMLHMLGLNTLLWCLLSVHMCVCPITTVRFVLFLASFQLLCSKTSTPATIWTHNNNHLYLLFKTIPTLSLIFSRIRREKDLNTFFSRTPSICLTPSPLSNTWLIVFFLNAYSNNFLLMAASLDSRRSVKNCS